MAKTGHPLRRFTAGNSDSLKATPERNGVDVQQKLKDYHGKYYVANIMTLAICSNETLNEMESWLEDLFGQVPSSQDPLPTYDVLGDPFDSPAFAKLYRIVPVNNICKLEITWSFENQLLFYKSKPLSYIASLLGDEGEGSLIYHLRKRNLARQVTVDEVNGKFAKLSINVSLTPEGFSHWVDIVTSVYQYILMLRTDGVQQWLYQEMVDIYENEFNWPSVVDPQEYVMELSMNMQSYDIKDYISGSKMMKHFDDQLIVLHLEKMKPDNMNVSMWSKTFLDVDGLYWETEPYFGTSYSVSELKSEWIDQWSNSARVQEFRLPTANIYIASNLSIKVHNTDDPIKYLEAPISTSAVSRLWHKPDNTFQVPKGYIRIQVMSEEALKTSTNICSQDLYVMLMQRLTAVTGYPPSVAGLRFVIKSVDRSLTLEFDGFSDKLMLFFENMISKISHFDPTDEEFNQAVEELAEHYEEVALSPDKLARDLMKSLLHCNTRSVLKKIEFLRSINYAQLKAFAANLFRGYFMEILVQGNLTVQEAAAMEAVVLNRFSLQPATDLKVLCETEVTKIPFGCSVLKTGNHNSKDENGSVITHIQIGRCTDNEKMLLEMILANMEEPLFDALRYNMPLGYDVNLDRHDTFGISGASITVSNQASKFSADFVDFMVDVFLDKYNTERLQSMSQKSFEDLVKTVIATKGEVATLEEEVEKNWNRIIKKKYNFNNEDAEIAALGTLTLDDLKNFSQRHIKPNPQRMKLSIKVTGHIQPQLAAGKRRDITKAQKERAKHMNGPLKQISDAEEYKAGCEKYKISPQI